MFGRYDGQKCEHGFRTEMAKGSVLHVCTRASRGTTFPPPRAVPAVMCADSGGVDALNMHPTTCGRRAARIAAAALGAALLATAVLGAALTRGDARGAGQGPQSGALSNTISTRQPQSNRSDADRMVREAALREAITREDAEVDAMLRSDLSSKIEDTLVTLLCGPARRGARDRARAPAPIQRPGRARPLGRRMGGCDGPRARSRQGRRCESMERVALCPLLFHDACVPACAPSDRMC